VEEVTPPAKATPAKPKGTAGKRPRASEDARASSKGRSSSVAPVEEATPPAKATPAKPKGSTGKRPRASEDGAPGSAKAGRKSDMDAAMVERIVRSLNNSTGKICWATGEGIKEPINDMGETFLHWAAFNGDSDAVRWLVDSGADCSAKDKLGKTPLCRCANGDSDCVKLLLQSNTDVNHQDADGVTALHRAALAQCVTNLQLLLRAGALPNACSDATGHSPLHDACFGGDLKCAQALVTHGAQVDMHVKAGKGRNNAGAQALHFAAQQGNDEVVKFLLKKGASVNAKDGKGCTALHYAAYTGCTTVVATLMQNRADPAVVNADGQRPLDLTGKSKLAPRGMTEISLLLQGKDALPDKGGCVVS